MNDPQSQTVDGLVLAIAFDGKGGGRDIGWDEIAHPVGEGTLLRWLHLDFTDPNAQRWIKNHSGVSQVVGDALLDEDSRPRAIDLDKGILVILRGLNTNPGADPEDMVSIRIWLEPTRVISTRRRTLWSVSQLHGFIMAGHGPQSTGDFLVQLVTLLGERIGPIVDQLDAAIEEAEGSFDASKVMDYQGEFATLRRQSARIRRYLLPQRDALEQMARQSTHILNDDHCAALREQANEMTRHLEDLDLVRERSMVAQEELLGQLALEQNRRMYVLSLVAAVFLPLSFLTGLMGMNVAGLPGTKDSSAFGTLSLAMIGVALGILGLFKWKKWM